MGRAVGPMRPSVPRPLSAQAGAATMAYLLQNHPRVRPCLALVRAEGGVDGTLKHVDDLGLIQDVPGKGEGGGSTVMQLREGGAGGQ